MPSLTITPIFFKCLLSISKNFSLKTLFKIKIIALIRILYFFKHFANLIVFCKMEMFSLFYIKCFTATLMLFISYWKKNTICFLYIFGCHYYKIESIHKVNSTWFLGNITGVKEGSLLNSGAPPFYKKQQVKIFLQNCCDT